MNQFFDIIFTLFLGLLFMFVLTVTSSMLVQRVVVQHKDIVKYKTDLKLFEKM